LTQISADALSLDPSQITVLVADTSNQSDGTGTFHSRSTMMGGSAVLKAAKELLAQAQDFARLRLNESAARLTFENGYFFVTDAPERRISLFEIAAGREGGLDVEARFEQDPLSFSFGVHAVEVAVLPSTGEFDVKHY